MSDDPRRKLDPLLRHLSDASTPATAGTDRLTETSAPSLNVLIAFNGTRDELAALGVSVSSFDGGIATGTVNALQLNAVAADPRVESVEASRPMRPELDLSRAAIAADSVPAGNWTGQGVIVGVVDTGIDLWHPAFRREDGSSAIVSIWDQTLTPVGTQAPPAGFGYGVEYGDRDIASALEGDREVAAVRHRDTNGHGTHVAAIAVGRADPYRGIAPDADLVVVSVSHDAKAFGDSARTLDAVRYIFDTATRLGRPAVVNLSLGSYLGPHDGTSLLERGIDALLSQPGRALVKAAGNAGGTRSHASGNLAAGETVSVGLEVPPSSREAATIDLWYPQAGDLEVQLTAPDGSQTPVIRGDEIREYYLAGGNRALVSSILGNPGNGDNRIYLVLAPQYSATLLPGRWQIALKATQSSAPVRFDAWIERDNRPPRFSDEFADDRLTLSIPGTARRCITVAAFASQTPAHRSDPNGEVLPFSSQGPTRDGRSQPALAAPGGWIVAARSRHSQRPAFGSTDWTQMSGTSMAAPHVSGAIARLLQQQPDLTGEAIRDRLQQAALPPTSPDPDRWGAGKLHLAGLFAAMPIVRANSPHDREGTPPEFSVQPGGNPYYAVEVAAETALFLPTARERRHDANFFASWRSQPLHSSPTYTLASQAWAKLRGEARLFYRIVTSDRRDRWSNVVRSTPNEAIDTAPAIEIRASVHRCQGTSVERIESIQPLSHNSKPMTNPSNQPNQPLGEPPADMNATEPDTTNAALSVTSEMAGLAGRSMGVPPARTEDAVRPDYVSGQALPSSSYGKFIRRVGLAAADAQKSLDENSVESAIALAETEVPALIAMNQVVNEDGEIEQVEPVVQENARLIQYIQPTFYQFRTIRMFARFNVSSFDASGETNITSARSGRNDYYGRASASGRAESTFLGIGIGGGRASGSSSFEGGGSFDRDSSTSVDSSFEAARSSGYSYMYAELTPRTDTRFPSPIVAVQGPRLTLSASANDLPAPAADATSPATLELTVTMFKKDGFRQPTGKTVEFQLNGPGILGASSIVLTPVQGDNKRLQGTVILSRRASDSSGTATITASIGTLVSSLSVDFPLAQ
jgi:subtilisin family serine protease